MAYTVGETVAAVHLAPSGLWWCPSAATIVSAFHIHLMAHIQCFRNAATLDQL